MKKTNPNYCKQHKQLFCLCQASRLGLVEMRSFTFMDELFYFSRREHYSVVFDRHLQSIPALSDLPEISEDQAKWLAGIYWTGYLSGRAAKTRSGDSFTKVAPRTSTGTNSGRP